MQEQLSHRAPEQSHLLCRPHAFKAVYTVTLHGEQLRTDFRVLNTGDQPFDFTAALHSYFEVLDIEVRYLGPHLLMKPLLQLNCCKIPTMQMLIHHKNEIHHQNAAGGAMCKHYPTCAVNGYQAVGPCHCLLSQE